ncbi:MAG TPA: protein kinase [Thermoanaerobaculia bacterium]|nr:protein kinase [Thermoanaerobaculia bacterium]
MIYVRVGSGPDFQVLTINDEDGAALEVIAREANLALRPANGSLGPIEDGVPVDYKDAGEGKWTWAFIHRLEIHGVKFRRVEYNERSDAPELAIEAPDLGTSWPWMNPIAQNLFNTLRRRFLNGSVGIGTIAAAHEFLTLARRWSDAAAEDALLLLVRAALHIRDGLCNPQGPIDQLLLEAFVNPRNFEAADYKSQHLAENFGEQVGRWVAITRAFIEREWIHEISNFCVTAEQEFDHARWMLDRRAAAVLSYLQYPDLSLDELRDLMHQLPPAGYRLIRILSTNSAFKVVYLARDPAGREVVLKRYKWGPQDIDDLAKRLATTRERMLEKDTLSDWMGTVRHPNIQPCMLLHGGHGPFLLEPRLERTLDDPAIRSHPNLIRLLRGVFEAAAYLHARGIVHTDIKPDNIGIRDDEALLLDFGIATSDSATTKSNPGSIKTRAPELFGNAVVPTAASDVWALGATVMAIVSGGDYPLLSREDLRDLPPAHDPRRKGIEEKIARRIDTFRRDPQSLEEHIRSAFPSAAMPLCELVLRACRIEPGERRPCAELLDLLN